MNDPSHPPSPAGDDDLPPRPARPAPEDCCKGDCNPCILELYDRQVEQWEREVAEILRQRKEKHAEDRHS